MPATAIPRIRIPLTPIHTHSIPTATTEGFWPRQSRLASAAGGDGAAGAGDGMGTAGAEAAGDGMGTAGAEAAGATDRN